MERDDGMEWIRSKTKKKNPQQESTDRANARDWCVKSKQYSVRNVVKKTLID